MWHCRERNSQQWKRCRVSLYLASVAFKRKYGENTFVRAPLSSLSRLLYVARCAWLVAQSCRVPDSPVSSMRASQRPPAFWMRFLSSARSGFWSIDSSTTFSLPPNSAAGSESSHGVPNAQ